VTRLESKYCVSDDPKCPCGKPKQFPSDKEHAEEKRIDIERKLRQKDPKFTAQLDKLAADLGKILGK
jgi:hypothetical protein